MKSVTVVHFHGLLVEAKDPADAGKIISQLSKLRLLKFGKHAEIEVVQNLETSPERIHMWRAKKWEEKITSKRLGLPDHSALTVTCECGAERVSGTACATCGRAPLKGKSRATV